MLVNSRLNEKKRAEIKLLNNFARPKFHVSSFLILTFEEESLDVIEVFPIIERSRKIEWINVNLFQQMITCILNCDYFRF